MYGSFYYFDEVQFIFFPLAACVLGVMSKKPLLNPASQRLTLMFHSKSFIVAALILNVFDPFNFCV